YVERGPVDQRHDLDVALVEVPGALGVTGKVVDSELVVVGDADQQDERKLRHHRLPPMSAGVLGRPSRVGRDAAAVVLVTRAGAEVARWPLRRTDGADLSVVDGLARLQLAARRR